MSKASDRQRALRDRRKAGGMVRKEYWATPEQHKQLAKKLKRLQNAASVAGRYT